MRNPHILMHIGVGGQRRQEEKMLKSNMHVAAALALGLTLAGTSASFGAEKNIFKDLPGVAQPKGFSAQSEEQPDCTSELVSPYYRGQRQMPIRMYTCNNGLVTYGSTVSPGFTPPAGDPYVHGENLLGFPGTPN